LSPEDAEDGIDLLVVVEVSAGSESVSALKRVRVSTSMEPNTNPVLEELQLADSSVSPVSVDPGVGLSLRATPAAGSQQPFDGPDGPTQEEMRFTWLATAGQIETPVTFEESDGAGENTWTSPDDGDATLWVIMRDGRGGVDWSAIQASLVP
jgi:hypothetical protein